MTLTEEQRIHAEVIARRLTLVQGCDYRGHRVGCGCGDGRLCGMGKGRGQPPTVTLADCFACVQDRTWEGVER